MLCDSDFEKLMPSIKIDCAFIIVKFCGEGRKKSQKRTKGPFCHVFSWMFTAAFLLGVINVSHCRNSEENKVLLGIGGGHYVPRHLDIIQ